MSDKSLHVLIIGGGVAGLSLSLFLKRAGISSAVYEAYSHLDNIGVGLQIAPNGMKVLEKLGLADQLIQQSALASRFAFFSPQGKIIARVANGNRAKYGQPAVTMSRAVLHKAIEQKVLQAGIEIDYAKRLKAISYPSPACVMAHFEDGTTAEGDLLIGADGTRSATRQLTLPDAPRPSFTNFLGVGGIVPRSIVPIQPENQESINMLFGPEGFFGYSDCSPTEVMWWTNLYRETEPTRQALDEIATEMLRQELLGIFNGWPEPVQGFLKNAPDITKTNIYDIPHLPHWYKDRVLLIGDAAHSVHPTAGQGASLALEDAMYLASLLRRWPDQHAKVFAQFELERRPRVERVIEQARRYNGGKKASSPLVSWFRNRTMAIAMPLFLPRSLDWLYRYEVTGI